MADTDQVTTLLTGGVAVSLVSVLALRAAASGRMPRNGLIGIRIPAFTRSEEAWQRGHALALPSAVLGAVCGVVIAVASVAWLATGRGTLALVAAWATFWVPIAGLVAGIAVAVRRLDV